MALFLDKHLNYLNNKIKQKIICIPFVLTSDDDLFAGFVAFSRSSSPRLTIFVFIYNIFILFRVENFCFGTMRSFIAFKRELFSSLR